MQAVVSAGDRGVLLLPAHPHCVADHDVEGQVIVQVHLGVGRHEGDQGQQGLAAELAVFGRFDLAEQVVDLAGEIVLAGRLFAQQGLAFKPVALVELVADDDAAAVVQQLPDAGVKVPRHPPQGPQA